MRPLDDKRFGLLARMMSVHACVCSKRIQEPLIRRGFTRQIRKHTYEITKEGEKFVTAEVKRHKKPYTVETWGGITIGNAVMIVTEQV